MRLLPQGGVASSHLGWILPGKGTFMPDRAPVVLLFFTLAEFSNSSPKKIEEKKGIKHEEPLGNDAGGFGVLNKTGFLQKKHHKNTHEQPRTVFKSVHGVFFCAEPCNFGPK